MQPRWQLKFFDELSPSELYAALRLRSEVFVVEQQCIFLDMDSLDQQCWHLLGYVGEQLAAYVRILPPGLSYQQPSIGRVVTSPSFRGKGAGRSLMQEAIKRTRELFGNQDIKIGAQLYLKKFYGSLGFEPQGDIYLEDGIQHIHMILKP